MFANVAIAANNLSNVNPSLNALGYTLLDSINIYMSALKTLDSLLSLPGGETNTFAKMQRNLCWEKVTEHYGDFLTLDAQVNAQRNTVIDGLIAANSLVTVSNVIESNLKQINALYFQVMKRPSFVITGAEALAIKPIADQCPLEGGKAVITARNLYNLFQRIYVENNDTCGGQENRSNERGDITPLIESSKIFQVLPNPTTGLVNILCNDLAFLNQPLRIDVCDLTGRILESKSLKTLGNDSIDLSHLPNGLYEIRISTQTGYSQTQKLVLVK